MNFQQTNQLLALLAGLNQKQRSDEIVVGSWKTYFDRYAPGMPYAFAEEQAYLLHRRLHDRLPVPEDFARAWRDERDRSERLAIGGEPLQGTPMPEAFKEAWRNLGRMPDA